MTETTHNNVVSIGDHRAAQDDEWTESDWDTHCHAYCVGINPAAWIDPDPEWASRMVWIEELDALFPRTGRAFRARLRLRLPGGAPTDTALFTVAFRPGDDMVPYYWDSCTVRATVRHGDGLTRHHQGRIDSAGWGKSRAYVEGLPADVAERVAALVRTIADAAGSVVDVCGTDGRAVLLAAINPHRTDGGQCVVCNRALRDEVSKALGIGPDCAKRAGIPHTLAAAGAALSHVENA